MKVYSLSSCDTCRKAVKALTTAHPALEVVDIRKDELSTGEVETIVDALGWETALNRRSTTWRGLSDADKADPDDAKAVALITAHPTLMKRPVVTDGKTFTAGWKADAQDAWL